MPAPLNLRVAEIYAFCRFTIPFSYADSLIEGVGARAVLASHRLHHARRDKEGCVSFGFLLPLSAERRRRARREESVLP